MLTNPFVQYQEKLNHIKLIWRESNLGKILMTLILLATMTTGVFLTQQTTRLFSKAAGESVTISFSPASVTLPQTSNVKVMMNAATNKIVYARVVFQFNPTKVKLTGNINPGSALDRVVEITDIVTANQTGKVVIALGAAPGSSTLPTAIFELANFNLQAVSTLQNDLSTLDFVSPDMEVAEKSEIDLPMNLLSTQLVLNPVTPTPVPTSTLIPTLIPTRIPTLIPTSTPKPTVIPTIIPFSTPKPTLIPTLMPTLIPTLIPTRIPTLIPTPTPVGGIQTLIFVPTDDTTIYANSRSSNSGKSGSIRIDNSPINQFLMKFNISGLGTKKVVSAKLRLYNTQNSVFGGSFYRTGSSWSQSNVNWSTAPAASGFIASLGSVGSGRWYEVNLTSYIIGEGTYSIRATSNTSDGADYSSKEGAHPPQLVLTVAN